LWTRQRRLLGIMSDEAVPSMKILVQEQMLTIAVCALRFDQKEKMTVNFRSAWNRLVVVLMCLAREEDAESH
jgi:hypothetical protein